jgi:flagellar motility protein MotE (MotC chaperone)
MMRLAREFRLLPVVLFATICLFTLKMFGILLDGGYTLGGSSAPASENTASVSSSDVVKKLPATLGGKQSWAQEIFGYPEVTGSTGEPPAVEKPLDTAARITAPSNAGHSSPSAQGTRVSLDNSQPASATERALLERLQERRQELEARARELDIRDGLLKAAEKRLETRISELKELETRAGGAMQKKGDTDANRFKGLVSMYENMKAKDAAKIFDRLDLAILVQVTSQINPRRMSDILGQMSPEAAERLTVELASRAMSTERIPSAAELPKIQGKPSGT